MRLSVIHRIGPYGLSAAIQAVSAFIVLPLLLLALGADAYGRFALLEPVVVVLGQLLLLGTHQGLIHAVAYQGIEAWKMTKMLLLGIQAYAVPMLLLMVGLVRLCTGRLDVAAMFGLVLYLESLNVMLMTLMRARGKAWAFCTAVIAKAVAALVAVSTVSAGLISAPADEMVGLVVMAISATVSIIVLLSIVAQWPAEPDAKPPPRDSVRRSIQYGFPLILGGLCQTLLAVADRYVLSYFLPSATVAAYVVCHKYASALNLMATPVNLWWPTARFQHQKSADLGRSFFRRATASVGVAYAAGAAALVVAAGWLLPKLGPGVAADPFVASTLIVASFLMAIQVVLNVGLLNAGQTHKILYIAAAVAAVHVGLCASLAARYGALGVACAAVVSNLLFAVGIYLASQKVLAVRQPLGLLTGLLLALAVLALGLQGRP